MFEGEFDFFGQDDGHRLLLQDAQGAVFGQAVGGELFALQGVDFSSPRPARRTSSPGGMKASGRRASW